MEIMINYNKKTSSTPKGYRLKPATHKLIIKIQRRLKWTQEEVLSKAC
jgi:hypothetical protein